MKNNKQGLGAEKPRKIAVKAPYPSVCQNDDKVCFSGCIYCHSAVQLTSV